MEPIDPADWKALLDAGREQDAEPGQVLVREGGTGGSLFIVLRGSVLITRGGRRIDDTDDERELPGAQEEIERDLRWLGLEWDEGPVRQSDRRQRHLAAAAAAAGAYTRDGAVWLAAPGASEFVIVRSDGRPTYR